jgi:hypothetical protein
VAVAVTVEVAVPGCVILRVLVGVGDRVGVSDNCIEAVGVAV